MTPVDSYRKKAAELRAKARFESTPETQGELEGLARAYIRLAEQAERNQQLDLTYETPPPKDIEPDV